MKKMLLFTLLLGAYTMCNQDIARSMFKDKKWEYIDFIFITQPENEYISLSNQFKQFAVSSIPPLMICGYDYLAWLKLAELPVTNFREFQQTEYIASKIQSISTSMAIVLFFATSYFYNHYNKNNIMLNHATRFIKDWPNNKEYTPEEFHTLFEKLYMLYKKEGYSRQFKTSLYETIKCIHHAIHMHFPQRYRKQTLKATISIKEFFMPWIFAENPSFS